MLLPIPGKKLKKTVVKPAERQSARQKKAGELRGGSYNPLLLHKRRREVREK